MRESPARPRGDQLRVGIVAMLLLGAIAYVAFRPGQHGPRRDRAVAAPAVAGARVPRAMVRDTVDVTVIDSTGVAGVMLCAPLDSVTAIFPHAIDTTAYCPDEGCDAPYPAKLALTRGGDTIQFHSLNVGDGPSVVQLISVSSPRIASPHGARVGMSVGALLAAGERIEVDSSEVGLSVTPADTARGASGTSTDTVRFGPNVLRLRFARDGVIGEIWKDVDKRFTAHLVPGRPLFAAVDTGMRIETLTARKECQ